MIKVEGFDFAFDNTACDNCKALCCKGDGYVFLDTEDIKNIASFLNMKTEEFLKLYTKKAIYGKKISLISLKIKDEIKCVFLDDDNRCEIYATRPKQCKSFPFWLNLKDKNKERLVKLCPGINMIYD